jgi:hypothetical protein
MDLSPDKRSERPVKQIDRPPVVCVSDTRVLARAWMRDGRRAASAGGKTVGSAPDRKRWSGNEVRRFGNVNQRSSQRGGVHG